MLLCAHGPYPANQPEPRAAKPSPTSFTLSRASVRFANAPASAQVHHILSAFVRSCSADKEKEKNKKAALIFYLTLIICISAHLKSAHSKGKGEGRGYRSTSPSTKSMEPTMAIRSAMSTPLDISGNTERLLKLGPRDFTRVGISDRPSAIK